MTTIYAYEKHTTPHTIVSMLLPSSPSPGDCCTELCTLDGITYVSVPDGLTLPAQPSEIKATKPTLTPEIKERIKASSPHVALIYERTEAIIRQKYTASDEAKFARIGVGAALGAYTFGAGEQDELLAFGAHCEAARQWGRDQRAALGL